MTNAKRRRRSGFSLVEIIVTMTILAFLSGSAVMIGTGARDAEKKRNSIASTVDALSISEAASLYATLEGREPSVIDDLFRDGYLRGDNQSPWGTRYEIEKKDGGFDVAWVDDSGEKRLLSK